MGAFSPTESEDAASLTAKNWTGLFRVIRRNNRATATSPARVVDYTLKPSHGGEAGRVVPSRASNLRAGGGRKDTPGWTEHTRRSNRKRFDSLRPYIKTGVTICYPPKATLVQLKGFNACVREFCKEKGIPARSVWEGPGRHQHMALGIEYHEDIERAWKARLQKRWLKVFAEPMRSKDFLWKQEIEPEKIASYLSKTSKDGVMVKGTWPWLLFNPVWEVGFRQHSPPSEKQRGKSASQYSAENERAIHRQPRKTRGKPHNTKAPENEGEILRSRGTDIRTGGRQSYWDSVPLRIQNLPPQLRKIIPDYTELIHPHIMVGTDLS